MKEILLQIIILFNTAGSTVSANSGHQTLWQRLMASTTPTYDEVVTKKDVESEGSTDLIYQSYDKTKTELENEAAKLKAKFSFLVSSTDSICGLSIPQAYYSGPYEEQKPAPENEPNNENPDLNIEDNATLHRNYKNICRSLFNGAGSCNLEMIQVALETREDQKDKKYFPKEECFIVGKPKINERGSNPKYGKCTEEALKAYQKEVCGKEANPNLMYQSDIYTEAYEDEIKTMIGLAFEIDQTFQNHILPNICKILNKMQKTSSPVPDCNKYMN